MLVPGAAPHRPAKRWPAARFRALAGALAAGAVTPVVVGGAADRALGAAITAGLAGAVDLTGRTDLAGLARLCAGAAVAIGNDTGPMHVAAAMGCPSVVLFSAASDPALTAPRGPAPVRVLRRRVLGELDAAEVLAVVEGQGLCPWTPPKGRSSLGTLIGLKGSPLTGSRGVLHTTPWP